MWLLTPSGPYGCPTTAHVHARITLCQIRRVQKMCKFWISCLLHAVGGVVTIKPGATKPEWNALVERS
jgi:hypothetical protein